MTPSWASIPFLFPLDSLSPHTKGSTGFYLFFPPLTALPLSLIPCLHPFPTSVSPLPSFLFSVLLRFIPYFHCRPPSSSHFYLWHAILLSSLQGTLLHNHKPLFFCFVFSYDFRCQTFKSMRLYEYINRFLSIHQWNIVYECMMIQCLSSNTFHIAKTHLQYGPGRKRICQK